LDKTADGNGRDLPDPASGRRINYVDLSVINSHPAQHAQSVMSGLILDRRDLHADELLLFKADLDRSWPSLLLGFVFSANTLRF